MNRTLRIVDGREAFIEAVASAAQTVICDAIARKGKAHVALTGGTMGIAVLTGFDVSTTSPVDWSQVHFWWGDERFVEHESADRNCLQAREAFISAADVPEGNVHEMPAANSGLSLDEAASAYAHELSELAQAGSNLPEFDLTFLGIGPDAHVASLFPDHPDAKKPGTVVSVRNSPKPPPERISLTYSALNASKRIWVVACGADKAEAVALMMSNQGSLSVPSSCVNGRDETVLWADNAASSLI